MELDSFSRSRVLITGGCGFIGSHLARRLVHGGADVTIADNLTPTHGGNPANISDIKDSLTLCLTDVRDSASIAALIEGKDYLFNLAGQTSHWDSMSDPFVDLDINARSQLSILEAVRQRNRALRIVFASTRQVYGRARYLPVDEQHPTSPVDVNGINKLAGESFHQLYCRVYGIPTTCLRLTNTYGPGMRVRDDRQTFLGVWIRNVLRDRPIDVFGEGRQIRDFNYVDDVVEAFLRAAHSDEAIGKVINLGSSETISLAELATLLTGFRDGATWRLVPFPLDRLAIDIGDYYADWRQARTLLGWEPRISLREGLASTLSFFAQHGEAYWGPG